MDEAPVQRLCFTGNLAGSRIRDPDNHADAAEAYSCRIAHQEPCPATWREVSWRLPGLLFSYYKLSKWATKYLQYCT